MGLINQRINNLLNGVSEHPDTLRHPSQAKEQINGLSSPYLGLTKRPPSVHKAKLVSDPTGYDTAFIHEIDRGAGSRYYVVVANGEVAVYDADTGAAVEMVGGGSYFSYFNGASKIRASTAGDQTILVNCDKVVTKGSTTSLVRNPEALIWVQAGEVAEYKVVVNHVTIVYSPAAKMSPEDIAQEIFALCNSFLTDFTCKRNGSVVHLVRNTNDDFGIKAEEGREAGLITAIKGKVQTFTELPPRGGNGFTVEVTGIPGTEVDNHWLVYRETDSTTGEGVWEETVKPGTLTSLTDSTMPHILEFGGAIDTFVAKKPPILPGIRDPATANPQIVYGVTDGYPTGRAHTATIAGNAFSYTPGSPQEGSAVATGLAAVINAHADYTATASGGIITVSYTGANPLGTTVAIAFDPSKDLWVSKSYFPGVYVGATLKNLSDGSTGIVTADANGILTVGGGLSGGGLNKFQEGDDVAQYHATTPYFYLKRGTWGTREVGDQESCPWPSFAGHKIQDVFHYQGRLGFLSDGAIILSRTRDTLQFFRRTTTDLLADDPVDVTSSHPEAGIFHSAIAWNAGLYLWDERNQFVLSGEPVLTPATVRMDKTSSYLNSPSVHPISAGGRLFFCRARTGATQVMEYSDPKDYPATAEDLTAHVPSYVRGTPKKLTGDANLGFLAILSDTNLRDLFVYLYSFREDGVRQQASWSKWTFPPASSLIHVGMMGGILGIIVKRADGVFLETLDVGDALNLNG